MRLFGVSLFIQKYKVIVMYTSLDNVSLSEYILKLKELSKELNDLAEKNNDLTLRDKHCLVREIYTDLESIKSL